MNDDDPADVAHERFAEQVLGGHPLGRPIGGTPGLHPRGLARRRSATTTSSTTCPRGLVVTVAGGVDHDAARASRSCRRCGRRLVRRRRRRAAAVAHGRRRRGRPAAGDGAGRRAHRAPQHRAGAPPARRPGHLPRPIPRRYAMSVLNAVLGGGMSSRLFQEMREKRGLAYSVYSFSSAYSDSGYFGLYAGCTPGKVAEVVVAAHQRVGAAGHRADRRGRARARHRPAQRRPRARHGGHRVADVAARQGRAGLRRVRHPRRSRCSASAP